MACSCGSGCLYAKEGKQRWHNFLRDEPPTYIDNIRILLDIIRSQNRIVPTDEYDFEDTWIDCILPCIIFGMVFPTKISPPSSSKYSSVLNVQVCFIWYHPNVRYWRWFSDKTGKSVTTADASIFVNLFIFSLTTFVQI